MEHYLKDYHPLWRGVALGQSNVWMNFKESALWANSICTFVCMSVHHTFSLSLTVFSPPLPKVQCSNFLDIRNFCGKVMERSGGRFKEILFIRGMKSIDAAFFVFFYLFTPFKGFFDPTS